MELVLIGIDMNQIIHRRGGLNPPECINRYTIGMLSGRFNLPLRWMAMLFISIPERNPLFPIKLIYQIGSSYLSQLRYNSTSFFRLIPEKEHTLRQFLLL